MKAIIMAGGQGKRLRPLTCTLPKPMLAVANKPTIEYAVDLLKKHGIHEIGITLQYLPNIIKQHLGTGREYDASFEYFIEAVPLGTAGSVKQAQEFLSDTFVVLSGDGITDIDITKAVEFHNTRKADVTIVLKRVNNPLEYGVVITDEKGKVLSFAEKPSWGEIFCDSVNTGIYIINKNVLDLVPKEGMFDFSNDLFPAMLQNGRRLYGYVAQGYWCDIGDLKSYIKANMDVITGRVDCQRLNGYTETEKGVFIGQNVRIEEGAVLEAPCIVGNNSVIGRNAAVGPETVIGVGSAVSESASIKHSVIHSNVFVGRECELRGCILCDDTVVNEECSIFEGSAIGRAVKLGEATTVKNSASVWPEKTAEANSVITENMIWQAAKYSGYFENGRICGKLNSQVTLKTVLISTSAFACEGRKKILLASNGTAAAKMMYSSARAGLMCVGSSVIEVGEMPLPSLRYLVRFMGADGGVYCGESSGNAHIFFVERDGADIANPQIKKIETALNNDTTQLSGIDDIKTPSEFKKGCEYYEAHAAELFGSVMRSDKKPAVDIVYGNSPHEDVLIHLLVHMGIKTELLDKSCIKENVRGESLTVALDEYGQRLIIYDEKLSPIDKDTLNLLMNYISVKQQKDEKYIVAQYNSPQVSDEIARANNGVIIRTKSGVRSVIEEIVKHDGIADGESIGRMSMYYDGIIFLLALIDVMIKEGKSFDELMSGLPALHMVEKEVECPWEKRCTVMRMLAENEKVAVGSGVKVTGRYGWSLVVPEEKRAVLKIYSEAFSDEYAEELTDICVKKIKEYIKRQ